MAWTKKQLQLWFWFHGDKIREHLKGLPHEKYIGSLYWRSVCRLVWQRAGGRCENRRCGKRGAEVHQKSYVHRGEEHEHLEDLRLLCRECYEETQAARNSLVGVLGNELTEALLRHDNRLRKQTEGRIQ